MDLVVSDFNGDLMTDLAVTGHSSDIVSVLMGNGDGTFRPHMWFRRAGTRPVSPWPTSTATAKRIWRPRTISPPPSPCFVGNGDGTFQAAQNFGVGLAPMAVAIADFNGDGKPDLAAANYFEGTVSVLIAGGGRAAAESRDADVQPGRRAPTPGR